jgi:hypothetical protein
MTCEFDTNICARIELTMNEFAEFESSAEYILSELEILE